MYFNSRSDIVYINQYECSFNRINNQKMIHNTTLLVDKNKLRIMIDKQIVRGIFDMITERKTQQNVFTRHL